MLSELTACFQGYLPPPKYISVYVGAAFFTLFCTLSVVSHFILLARIVLLQHHNFKKFPEDFVSIPESKPEFHIHLIVDTPHMYTLFERKCLHSYTHVIGT